MLAGEMVPLHRDSHHFWATMATLFQGQRINIEQGISLYNYV
jgi:hypothetical protein